jgi:hypothetical protein
LFALFVLCFFVSYAQCQSTKQVSSTQLCTNQSLADELAKRYDTDQQLRTDFIKWAVNNDLMTASGQMKQVSAEKQLLLMKKMTEQETVDKENQAWIKKQVENEGWPTITEVGPAGAKHAFMLVQHSSDRKFQKKCLALMSALDNDEIHTRGMAYLTDRLLVMEGKRQLYGTQLMHGGNGFEPAPIENPDTVDERRKSLGMETLGEYIKKAKAEVKSIASTNEQPSQSRTANASSGLKTDQSQKK